MNNGENICVLIPCFNAAKTIKDILLQLSERRIKIIVIDDGSTDSTAKAASEFPETTLLSNARNLGKGTALRKGFEFAIANGYDIIITMDGDGQHLVKDIEGFLKIHSEYPQADIIIGNRMDRPKGMPGTRIATNRFMSSLLSWITSQRIPDSQNGFRLIKRRVLEEITLTSERFEIESEIILRAAEKGFRIISLPVSSVYKNNPSSINPLIDTVRFIKFIFPYLMEKLIENKTRPALSGGTTYEH